jgi:hypothetical protein
LIRPTSSLKTTGAGRADAVLGEFDGAKLRSAAGRSAFVLLAPEGSNPAPEGRLAFDTERLKELYSSWRKPSLADW